MEVNLQRTIKIFFLLFLIFLLFQEAYAIDWIKLNCPNGRVVYLDSDSIKQEDNYYFYNIKFKDMHGFDVVVTMQSAIHKPFSARLNVYKIAQYEELNGDYDNIASRKTTKLEPVTYTSTVYTCYKKVKEILQGYDAPIITF